MDILVVGSTSRDGEQKQATAYRKFFKDALISVDIKGEVDSCYLDELLFWAFDTTLDVVNANNSRSVNSYDLVIFRGRLRIHSHIAYWLSKYLLEKNVPFFNTYEYHRGPFTKIGQIMVMRELGLKHPPTLYCANQAYLLKSSQKYLSFPLVAKDVLGAHGDNNFLVSSKEELQNIFETHPKESLLLQEYIPNECDYRILVAGSGDIIIRRNASKGSYLNNTSKGGSAKLIRREDFPEDVLNQAHHFAKALNMHLAGVDVMENSQTGEMIFLEINAQPQITSGAYTNEKTELIGKLLEKFNRELKD